ncbi:MAG: PIG-L family deacetylase [Hyphomicrobiaceae bacterium]|nr:PIG-L family deacetylase [Hyphomicrobiaceae bacterium]
MMLALAAVGVSAKAENPGMPERVSFYFAAHQDDWQLFMNPAAFEDVTRPASRAVFIYVTAGDAGFGTGKGSRRHPYYLARERGAELAVRFMADAENTASGIEEAGTVEINGHKVRRVAYRNTVSYFLRLADGGLSGRGYAATGHQSLRRLADAEIASMMAIDGSTSYQGWADLAATVRQIVDRERGSARAILLNASEPEARTNFGDHPDHQMTARLVGESTAGLVCAERVFHVAYASAKLPENLGGQERDLKTAVFAVTVAGIRELDHSANWRWYRLAYLGRSYKRAVPASAPCDPSKSAAAAVAGVPAAAATSRP